MSNLPAPGTDEASDNFLWRGAIAPSSIVAIIGVVAATLIRHKAGLFGSLLASLVVILFFSVHLFVAKISRNLDPMATMALAMFSYFAKVIVMGALLLIVTRTTSPKTVDRISFAVVALCITAAWLAGEIRAFLHLRFQLPLPPSSK